MSQIGDYPGKHLHDLHIKTMKTFSIAFIVLGLIAVLAIIFAIDHKEKDPWRGVDRSRVIGTTLDSCRCTIINDKFYRVNIEIKQHHTFTEIEKP